MAGLAGLIIGCASAEGEGAGPRAALPLLGQSLVEYQARQAAAAGARHIVILVERVPAALTAAVDRLKRDGIAAELARSVADAADRIHPDERLLLIGDGIVARQDLVTKAARMPAPALLTVPDSGEALHYERIDSASRWAGLAVTDGAVLRRTVAMLGDWDLQSTLLRRLVQAGATRIEAGAAGVSLVTREADARAAESVLMGSGRWHGGAVKTLLERGIKPVWLRVGAVGLALLALPVLFAGYFAIGAGLLALSGPVDGVPRRMDAAALRGGGGSGPWEWARTLLALAAIPAAAWALVEAQMGWGVWPVAAAGVGVGALLIDQAARRGEAPPDPAWLGIVLLAASVLSLPLFGLAAIAVAAFALLWLGQRRMGPAPD